MAGIKTGLIENTKEIAAGWQHDLTVNPKTNREPDYQGWQAALKATFAAANAKPTI